MDIDEKVTVEGLVKTAGVTIDAISGTLNPQMSALGRILVAYGPEKISCWIMGGRLRLTQLKKQEEAFSVVCNGVVDHYKKLIGRSTQTRGNSPVKSAFINLSLEQLQHDIQLLTTINKALAMLPDVESTPHDDQEKNSSSPDQNLWWDNFESMARRRNEPWRTELLARALVEVDSDPEAISLKALWEIGMLDYNDFRMLAVFCDSALLVDGKPLVLIDPEDQVNFEFDIEDGTIRMNLAYIVADLIDSRLIQKAETQFDTSEPVELKHASGSHLFTHKPPNSKPGDNSAIQIAAYGPTDYGLDICRLYTPISNPASDASFEVLKSTLEASAKEDANLANIKFENC